MFTIIISDKEFHCTTVLISLVHGWVPHIRNDLLFTLFMRTPEMEFLNAILSFLDSRFCLVFYPHFSWIDSSFLFHGLFVRITKTRIKYGLLKNPQVEGTVNSIERKTWVFCYWFPRIPYLFLQKSIQGKVFSIVQFSFSGREGRRRQHCGTQGEEQSSATWTAFCSLLLPTRYKKSTLNSVLAHCYKRFLFRSMDSFLLSSSTNKV